MEQMGSHGVCPGSLCMTGTSAASHPDCIPCLNLAEQIEDMVRPLCNEVPANCVRVSVASSPSKKASPTSFALFSMTAATLLGDEPPTSDACSSDCSTSSSKDSLTCLFPLMGADARGNQYYGLNMCQASAHPQSAPAMLAGVAAGDARYERLACCCACCCAHSPNPAQKLFLRHCKYQFISSSLSAFRIVSTTR